MHELPNTTTPASANIQAPATIGTSANFSQDLDEDLCMTFSIFLVFMIAECKEFNRNVVIAEIAVGERKGSIVFIPRIPLQPNNAEQCPIQFTRRQFPVRICFAMTINKAQGQTLNRVGIYLPQPAFSHGQIYVGMSRATTATNIRIQILPSNNKPLSSHQTKNIVYSELLAEAQCD